METILNEKNKITILGSQRGWDTFLVLPHKSYSVCLAETERIAEKQPISASQPNVCHLGSKFFIWLLLEKHNGKDESPDGEDTID